MGHKCLRFDLFKIDENLAFCDIPAGKLTLEMWMYRARIYNDSYD
jgi:hypothetical protein